MIDDSIHWLHNTICVWCYQAEAVMYVEGPWRTPKFMFVAKMVLKIDLRPSDQRVFSFTYPRYTRSLLMQYSVFHLIPSANLPSCYCPLLTIYTVDITRFYHYVPTNLLVFIYCWIPTGTHTLVYRRNHDEYLIIYCWIPTDGIASSLVRHLNVSEIFWVVGIWDIQQIREAGPMVLTAVGIEGTIMRGAGPWQSRWLGLCRKDGELMQGMGLHG
jgi:hypothetical protein